MKGKITKTYITTEGTLYKDSTIRVEPPTKLPLPTQVRVKDDVGKIYYVNSKDLVLL